MLISRERSGEFFKFTIMHNLPLCKHYARYETIVVAGNMILMPFFLIETHEHVRAIITQIIKKDFSSTILNIAISSKPIVFFL